VCVACVYVRMCICVYVFHVMYFACRCVCVYVFRVCMCVCECVLHVRMYLCISRVYASGLLSGQKLVHSLNR